MPKKKHNETPAEQSARFKAEVARLVEAGELSPTDAEARLSALVALASAAPEAQNPD